jgi:DNA polymerase-4
MDAFFASVEQARNPALRGKPVVVGGDPHQRGVVAAASYEARRYGIHSAMPLIMAYRLCPQAIFLRGNFSLYEQYSQRLLGFFRDLTPLVQPLGLDEAFLDLTGFEALYGPPERAAAALKQRIREELDLTASVGVASNKLVAKIASDLQKPDGLVVVPPGQEEAFLAPLPVGVLPGVGQRTVAALGRLGITRVGELAEASLASLRSLFASLAPQLLQMARGIDPSPVQEPGEAKSISRSTTFPCDTLDYAFVRATLGYLVERVGARLRAEGQTARTIHLKLRFADFETVTRSRTLEPTDSDETIFTAALQLMNLALKGKKIRLVGVGVSGLGPRALQASFLAPLGDRHQRVDRCLDDIRARYGFGAIQRGRTLPLGKVYPRERDRYVLHTPSLSR